MSDTRTSRAYHRAFSSGELTPTEVARTTLDAVHAIEHAEPELDAFVLLDEERVLEQAEASTARYKSGTPLGPLDGVPIPIKDELDVQGLPTTCGAAFGGATLARHDAVVVERLLAAGAIILGKTSMHEIGLGGSGVNPLGVTARNPHDPAFMTGGSSSGAAAAVSSGVAPLAVGSDAGGSIRIPASLCGVYGLKPTYGRVPTTGTHLLAHTLDHLGPIGADLQSLADFLDVTAGAHPRDPASTLAPTHEPIGELSRATLRGKRFFYSAALVKQATPAIVDAFDQALDSLRIAGALIEERRIPLQEHISAVGLLLLVAEGAASQRRNLAKHRDLFSLPARLSLAIGERVSTGEYMQAQRVRAKLRAEVDALFGAHDYDAYLSPTTACAAQRISQAALDGGEVDSNFNRAISLFTFLGNLTGRPALTLPCGTNRQGLPLGLQLMGKPWREGELLSLGQSVDERTPSLSTPRVHQKIF